MRAAGTPMLLVLGAACQGPTEATEATDAPPAAGIRVEAKQGPVCADPTLRETRKFETLIGLYEEDRPWYRGDGSGVAIGDFDRDGRLDILVLGHEAEEYYTQTPEGDLVPAAPGWRDAGIDLSWGWGASVADYDADDDLDVFVTRYKHPNVLLQNDGNGYFVDVAPALGLQGPPEHHSSSSTWSDFDNDGDLDLYVAGHGHVKESQPVETWGPGDPDMLYVNNGDGTFTDHPELVPQKEHDAYGFVPLFLDFDGDGWRDLFMANDFGTKHTECLLMWNQQGQGFVLDDNAAGLDRTISAMGIGVGDVNEDGGWDLLLPAWGYMDMMMSTDVGIWFNYADALGLVPDLASNQVVGWADELVDMDNDTDLDAVVMFGYLLTTTGRNQPDQPHGLWLQQDDGTFLQVSAEWGVDVTDSTRGMGVADVNDDGYLDIAVPNMEGRSRLHMSNCGDAAYLKVALKQPGTLNRDAIGSVVEVVIGDRVLRRPVLAGGTGFGTGLPPIVHFGLGEHEVVDELVVHWPDGETSVVPDLQARQTVTVIRD